jgi:hypothetical protein
MTQRRALPDSSPDNGGGENNPSSDEAPSVVRGSTTFHHGTTFHHLSCSITTTICSRHFLVPHFYTYLFEVTGCITCIRGGVEKFMVYKKVWLKESGAVYAKSQERYAVKELLSELISTYVLHS